MLKSIGTLISQACQKQMVLEIPLKYVLTKRHNELMLVEKPHFSLIPLFFLHPLYYFWIEETFHRYCHHNFGKIFLYKSW